MESQEDFQNALNLPTFTGKETVGHGTVSTCQGSQSNSVSSKCTLEITSDSSASDDSAEESDTSSSSDSSEPTNGSNDSDESSSESSESEESSRNKRRGAASRARVSAGTVSHVSLDNCAAKTGHTMFISAALVLKQKSNKKHRSTGKLLFDAIVYQLKPVARKATSKGKSWTRKMSKESLKVVFQNSSSGDSSSLKRHSEI